MSVDQPQSPAPAPPPGPASNLPAPTPGSTIVDPSINPYDQSVDLTQVFTSEQIAQLKQHRLTSFNTGAAIALTILVSGGLTGGLYPPGGLFSTIFYGIKQGELPTVKQDDPSTGKFIGFMFIPFFNLYWMFFAWRRFVDRVNFQCRLRGQAPPISKGMATWTLICICTWFLIFPLIAAFILHILVTYQTQEAINRLAAEREPQFAPAPPPPPS